MSRLERWLGSGTFNRKEGPVLGGHLPAENELLFAKFLWAKGLTYCKLESIFKAI